MVVAPPAAKNKSSSGGGGGAKTLDARFTMLNAKRAEQVQRGTTARYAATMANRTGKDAKKFAVSGRPALRCNDTASLIKIRCTIIIATTRFGFLFNRGCLSHGVRPAPLQRRITIVHAHASAA
jgi:hypothetical protein